MINSRNYRALELFVLFVLIPVQLAIDWSISSRIAISVLGFLYAVSITIFVVKPKFTAIAKTVFSTFLKSTLLKFLVLVVIGIAFMQYAYPEKLFSIVSDQPKVWLFFMGVYSLFSVLPQEFLYRTYYFERYRDLIKNEYLFIL